MKPSPFLRAAVLAGIAAVCVSAQEASAPAIVDRPISFSAARIAATQAYIARHYGLKNGSIDITPRVIVVHWTALPSLEASWSLFNRETLGSDRPELGGAQDLNVSAQFLVDCDGTILRLMPETWMARHVIGLNLNAIGIENVGGPDPALTPAQVEADARLIRYLKAKYSSIDYLIGHYEYRSFEKTPLWQELEAGYRTAKRDPGRDFMKALRLKVADLGLQGPPARK